MNRTRESLFSTNKKFAAFLMFFFALLFTATFADWPELFVFKIDPHAGHLQKFSGTTVHLADDVMISLRAGYMLKEEGRPQFNRGDLAQASTSYLSPYMFALLLDVFPSNVAIISYAFIGLVLVTLTATILVLFSRSTLNGIILSLLLLATSTNFSFSMNGWDHLFQGFFLALATCVALWNRHSVGVLLTLGALLTLGSLARPDGVLISLGILISAYFSLERRSRVIALAVVPYIVMMGAALSLNCHQFGHLAPTTTRLKLRAAPSLEYILSYALANGALSYTALSLFLLLLVYCFVFRNTLRWRQCSPLLICCLLTALAAIYNSDIFPGFRMLWSPACCLGAMIAVSAPAILRISPGVRRMVAVSPEYRELAGPLRSRTRVFSMCMIFCFGFTILLGSLIRKAKAAAIHTTDVSSSGIAAQFNIVDWINRNLDPAEGSIGYFSLGLAYYAPRFESADFLGKADEMIATLPVKWGPPGHNKWDIDKTLAKWRPQAIVPGQPSDLMMPGVRTEALFDLNIRSDFAFAPELTLDPTIAKEFVYCYVPTVNGVVDSWGFFLRRDVAPRYLNQLRCR